jgi:hypothetical protein
VDTTYIVRALDRDVPGALREGPDSDPITVTATATPPGPVTGLTRTDLTGGNVKLDWTAPAGTPAAAFYRIYRDGVAFTDRYDRAGAGAGSRTWTDTRTDGSTHTYWVTAVSSQLAESTAVAAQ